MSSLKLYREKWREVPAGDDADGRVFAADLMQLSDKDFLATWEEMERRRSSGAMAWFGPLYRDFFRGRRILEIGSGAGVDGVPMAAAGAHWTFADIVPSNLETIRRVTSLKGIPAAFHVIEEDLSFETLGGEFDAIVVIGSIHHVPYDMTRREALNALRLLKVGGRWIELVYPRERWLREGSMPFDVWGRRTDGDRTPWVEWYDLQKVQKRLSPGRFKTILNFDLRSRDQTWIDLEYQGMGRNSARWGDVEVSPVLEAGERDGWTFQGPKGAFHPIARFDLVDTCAGLEAPYEVEVSLDVQRGAVGIGVVGANGGYLPDAEVIRDCAPHSQTATLQVSGDVRSLVLRNRHEDIASKFTLRRVRVREV